MKLFFHRRESMFFSYQRERRIWSSIVDQPSFIILVNFPGFCWPGIKRSLLTASYERRSLCPLKITLASDSFMHVAPLMLQYFSKQEVLLVCSSLLILLTSLSVVASFTDSLWVRPHTIFPHPIQRKEERRSETIDMTSVVCTIHCCYADWNWPVLNSVPLFFRPRVPFLKSHGNFSSP